MIFNYWEFFMIAIAWIFMITPLLAFAFFVVSLILFIISAVKRKRSPETFAPRKHIIKLFLLIISIVLIVSIIIIYYAILVGFANAIAYM